MDEQDVDQILNAFGMANLRLELNMKNTSEQLDLKLSDVSDESIEDDPHFFQFDERIRVASKRMSLQYQIFYCLENSIRQMIHERLSEKARDEGKDGWFVTPYVNQQIIDEAKKRKNKEDELGITERSERLIDYTDFGHLSQIIRENWDEVFDDMFSNKQAVQRVLRDINTLRAPIAHCAELADDEVSRLRLALTDWFNITSGP